MTLLARFGGGAKEKQKMLRAREIMWRRTMDDLSFELARIGSGAQGPELSGTVLVAEKGAPLRIEYRIVCDEDWRTRIVELSQDHLGTQRTLRLDHDGAGHWRLDGRHAPTLAGCTDVDLGVSPSTNALPVNRLRLDERASDVIRAAWVRFPALEVVPAEQYYERLGDRCYLYRSIASGFEAVVEVDEDGLPVEYAGVWRRVAEILAASSATATSASAHGLIGALLADGPSAELGDAAADFEWLIGGWNARVRDFDGDGRVTEASGEWWFAWVLEGRAMQDVWISPARADRAAPAEAAKDRYGTTIRRFDREAGLWRITWINPASGATNDLAGKREGNRIVLLGEEAGRLMRWSFNDIRSHSFTWIGESRRGDGAWRKEAEFELERMS